MPGPVSDAYDPEFGTAYNAGLVREAVGQIRDKISQSIGSDDLQYIVDVVEGKKRGPLLSGRFTEREFRIIRFALNRALESL